MIGRLSGNLIDIEGGVAVVECAGVGYEVTLPESLLLALGGRGERVEILTRQVFREESVTLYGFLEPLQRKLFDMLMQVKGCGPKIALSMIGQLGVDVVVGAITAQDVRALSRANGVGPRLAERIILELREKVQDLSLQRKIERSAAQRAALDSGDELVDALLALGYKRMEAETAADSARSAADGVEEQLRVALRSLQR